MIKKEKLPVSILSANFNNGPFLKDFFESIIASSSLPSQICIVDDGSSDNSVQIINQFKSKFESLDIKFSYILFNNNQGFGKALNAALEVVEHEFTLRIDPDDLMKPNRLELQIEFMKKNPKCAVLGGNIEYFSSKTKKKLRSSSVPLKERDILKNFLSGCVPLIHGSTFFRSDLLKKFKYRPEVVPAEDYDLFSRILKEGHMLCNIPEILTEVRVHNLSTTNFISYRTIEKTFMIREEVWSLKFSFFNSYRRFYNQKFYRKFLYDASITRFAYFFLAALLWPESIVRNLKSKFEL